MTLRADSAQASVATVPALAGLIVALGDSYTAGALLPADLDGQAARLPPLD